MKIYFKNIILQSSRLRSFLILAGSFLMLTGLSEPSSGKFKVGLSLDLGGKEDRSFCQAAYEGLMRAQKDLPIEVKVLEATDINAFETNLRNFARKDYDLIVSVGFSQKDAITKVAKLFPQKKFAIIDGEVSLPNVRAMLFNENEGAYLVGAVAALKSKTGKIGFIGGMDIPMMRRFQIGYEAGAKKVKPSVKVVSNFIGVTAESFRNPAKAKELALSQYNQGVDVIFHAAGGSGVGLFDAAEEKKKWAIGVDSNQNWMRPGVIITSMLKKVDVAVYDSCKDLVANQFSTGIKVFGVENGGVGFAMDDFNKNLLSEDIVTKVKGLEEQVKVGKIRVPDYHGPH